MRILAILVALLFAACTPTDVGQCCEATDPSVVPPPAFDQQGRPANALATDAKLLCSNITCVSFQGSQAYCTERCETDASCPGSFVCQEVIMSDPGPGGPTSAMQKFCVKADHACE